MAAAAAVVGLAAGGAIRLHLARPWPCNTWSNVRSWLTFAVIFLGLGAALLQLELQRRQLGVLQSDLGQRDQLLERQQAEAIDLHLVDSTADPPVYMINVSNGSRRPIRNVVCRIELAQGEEPQFAESVGVLVDWVLGGEVRQRLVSDSVKGTRVPVVRVGLTWAFVFPFGNRDQPEARIAARFTDDVGLHWQINHDLHLEKLENRDNW